MRAHLGTIGFLGIMAAALAAQDGSSPGDPQQPTFVTGVHSVRVDLYAMRDGRLVDDLRVGEIELYEDGVRQTIETFERIDIRGADPLAPALEPRTLDASRRAAADPRSRVFAVFLDRWHTDYLGGDHSPAVQARFPLLRQLETILGPDDLVGVMTHDMTAADITFIRGLGGLARLESTWDRYSVLRPDPGRDFDTQEELYLSCYPGDLRVVAHLMIARRRERMALDALEELAVHLGELREERKAVLVVTDGWRLYMPDPALSRPRSLDVPPRMPFSGPDGDRTIEISSERGASELSAAARARCEADRAALAGLDHRGRVRAITARANRANVSFYPISPAGLTTGLPSAGQAGRAPAFENATAFEMQATLRAMAEETDGLAVVNTNNVAEGIRRIDDDLSAYYLLGYTSTNAEFDGRFRRITVRVARPGVSVRARPGYLAPSALERRAATTRPGGPEPLDPVASALGTMANINLGAPVLFRGSAWTPAAGPEAHAGLFWVVGEIEPQARRDAAWRDGGSAEITVLAPDGSTLLSRTLDVPAIGHAFQLRVPDAGRVAPGEYSVRVRLRGGSGTTLNDAVGVTVGPDGAGLGEPVLWRRGPGTGPQHLVTADPRFRRNERLRLELPAASDAPATARLLDRAGAPLPIPVGVSLRADASETFTWIVADVALAPLAPGDYAIEIAQDDATMVTAIRIVP